MNSQIDKLIQERIFKYFPDLKDNKSNIFPSMSKSHIRLLSQIYKYDLVTNKNEILKTIYVKVQDTAKSEYKNLKYLRRKFASFEEFDVSRPLDFFPELNAIVTEECPGKNLYIDILRPYSLPFLRNYKEDYIRKSIFKTGEWLGTFHRLTHKKKGKVELDNILYSSKNILKKSSSQIGLDSSTINLIYKEMEELGSSISNQRLPIAWCHNDFRPIHSFISRKKVSVIDCARTTDHYFIYHDLSNFIVDLYTLPLYPLYSFNFSHSLCRNFLQGYVNKGLEISVPSLKFFEIVMIVRYLRSILDDLAFTKNFLKPIKLPIYTFLLKRFINKKFKVILNRESSFQI